jgi:hypothetical protein
MPFKPGQSGNPRGRTPGAVVPKITLQAAALAAAKGDVDSLAFLRLVVSAEQLDVSARLTAAGLLAPYEHSRKTRRKITEPLDLPKPATVEQAIENIAEIGKLAAAGKIGLDEANDLVGHQKAFVEAKVGTDIEAWVVTIETALRAHDIRPVHDLTPYRPLSHDVGIPRPGILHH